MPATDAPASEEKRKRVYTEVSVIASDGMFGVALDGRPLHTPGRALLATSKEPVAAAVAQEWDVQNDFIDPSTMPLTKLLNTAIDRVAPRRSDILSQLVRFAETDLLCYRAESPESLVERQEKVWQPVLDWLAAVHSVSMTVGQGLMPLHQPDEVTKNLGYVLSQRDDLNLTAVQATAALTGSIALALALADQHFSHVEVFAVAQLDETWQMENWGEDAEAMQRRDALEKDLHAIERFVSLSR